MVLIMGSQLFLVATQFRDSASDRDPTTNMYSSGIVVRPIQNHSYLSLEFEISGADTIYNQSFPERNFSSLVDVFTSRIIF